jgi:hypothetical protein
MDEQEMIQTHTYTLGGALAATGMDYGCDPEAALAPFRRMDDIDWL